MALKGGYLGLCVINNLQIRVTGFTLNVQQDVQFYDHIIGLRDSVPQGLSTKGDVGAINVQKYTWRPGVKIVSGNISFPATTESLQLLFDLVKTGDDFDVQFNYSCDDTMRVFNFCKINSFTFTATAGDILNVSVEVMGRHMEEFTGSNPYTQSQKLITWDNIYVSSISSDPVQAFSFTVNNNCMPIYTAGNNTSDRLFPKKIRVGMQNMTGTIIYYIKGRAYVDLDKTTDSNLIGISIKGDCGDADFIEGLCVIYKPIERSSNIGALLHTLPFVGVGKALSGALPSAPGSVGVPDSSTTGDYDVSWSYSGDEDDITNFELEEKETGGSYVLIASPAPSDRTYSITGQASGTYDYRIRAVGENGDGPYAQSNVITVT
jgi:hypothetical protein